MSEPGILRPPYRSLTGGIIAIVTLVATEAMGIATVVPMLAGELNGLRSYSLVFSGHITASLVALIAVGSWVDRRGPRQPLVAGLAAFAAGLVVAGVATDMFVFLAGRVLQGLGSGLAVAPLYAIVVAVYPRRLHPPVFALMSGAWVVPSVLAPVAAGAIGDRIGWRWVFLGLVPLVLPPAVFVLRGLRLMGTHVPHSPQRRFPLVAAVAVVCGLAVTQWTAHHPSLFTLAALTAAFAAIPRLLPRGTLRAAPGLPAAVLLRGLVAGAFFGGESFLPLLLVSGLMMSPSLAGWVLTGAAITWFAGSWLAGRTHRHWACAGGGGLLVAAGLAITAVTAQEAHSYGLVLAGWSVAGLGMGLALTSANLIAVGLSARARAGGTAAGLQLSEAFFSTLLIQAAGTVVLVLRGRVPGTTSLSIAIAVMCVPALVGAASAVQARGMEVTPKTPTRDAPERVRELE